jgi:hypothetical protein
MQIKSGSIEQFEQLSQFASLKEFNHHMEMWLANNKHEISNGELVGLKRLVRFAAKIPGVCNAKIGTMLKAIHDEFSGNGISRSTFKRMIQKAILLGIVTVHGTERKNGSQSSNLYVFNRFPISEPPKEEKMNHHNKTSNLFKTKEKEQKRNKRNETPHSEKVVEDNSASTPVSLDFTYTSNRVPSQFIQLVKVYFPAAKTIEEFWRMATIAAYRNNREKESNRVLEVAIESFKQLIRKMKSNTIVKKPIAFFYGIAIKKFVELYNVDLYEMGCNYETDLFGSFIWFRGDLVGK